MSDAEIKNAFEISYKFILDKGRVKEFLIKLDPETLQILNPSKPPFAAWADLKSNQCPNCPLNEKEFPQCPAAANLQEFVPFAEGLDSFEEAEIEVTIQQRVYRKKTAVQYGLSALMGIYMTTGGCPIMDKLRPMVKTHTPFAKADEVTYRTVSMYLLAQFFKMKEGKNPDWDLKGLVELNQEIETVNRSFWKRISAVTVQLKDGGVNALSHLNTIAKLASYQLQDDELKKMRALFEAHLKD